MLRTLGKTLGGTMMGVCLISTLAVAQTPMAPQGQPMTMTCTKDDGKGTCTAATGADGKEIVVVGTGLKKGATMTCVNRGNVVDCDPVQK
jgi:hypothetical protein